MTTQSTQLGASSNGTNNSWLPEDLTRQYPTLSNYKDPQALAKAHGELVKYQGQSVRLPGADAKPEDWDAFYAKVGRPEAPDKYEITFPDGMEVDQNLVSSFRGQAHKLGLTQAQAAGISNWFAEQTSGLAEGQASASAAQQGQWANELKQEWGWATDRNTNIASKGFASIFHDEQGRPYPDLDKVTALLDSTGLGNHPALIKAFHWVAQQRGEDRFVDETGPSETDKASAREELDRLMPSGGKMSREQWDTYSRPETQRRIAELREILNG